MHNGLADRRLALIARCRGPADIVAAVDLARALRLEVAVRGGVITWRAAPPSTTVS